MENVYSLHYINKLIYDMKYEAHKSNPVNKLQFYNFGYAPGLYEKLRYAVEKFNINLVAKTTRKLKGLIHSKIDRILNDESAGIYIITLVTETRRKSLYWKVWLDIQGQIERTRRWY